MNEMIYGNTGKRDGGTNIDMDPAFYQKLQSRTFVPKLKSMLSERLQECDKNFVFIGEVADKSGNFSVYGYNAKLENDNRGGDYGNYIAVPVDSKAVSLDIEKVKFLTEEGFVEYVNLNTLNDEKRFAITPMAIDIDVNAKKKIVNNLLETFMKVRKRKNVTFSFEDCNVEEFTSKAVYVLIDLMKYIPYQMRKNISFMSHIASNQKLPDMINLAVYASNSEFRPHDCINISGGAGEADGIFAEFVEKVFAMSDSERNAYFETIYQNIESPAISAGVDVRSDIYLLDVSTKVLWRNGDAKEAIQNIFGSIDDVLKVYPEYRELATQRLIADNGAVIEHIQSEIQSSGSALELKSVFDCVYSLFDVCDLQFNGDIIAMFTERANAFIGAADDDASLLDVLSGIVAVNVAVLDKEFARNTIRLHMSKKPDINSIYTLYLALKEGQFIDFDELDICLTESVEELILRETDRFAESKDKLTKLESLYKEFQTAISGADASCVKEVYDRYIAKYSGNAKSEAIDKGREILYEIDKQLRSYCTVLDMKNCVKKLAAVEVGADEALRQSVSQIYGRVSTKMFDDMAREMMSYEDFVRLIEEIAPAVNALDINGVTDGPTRSGWGADVFVADGMFRMVNVFDHMIGGLRRSDNMNDALLCFETAKKKYDRGTERRIDSLFTKYSKVVFTHWLHKNRKIATKHNFSKAEKALEKEQGIKLSQRTVNIFDDFINDKSGKKKPSIIKLIIIAVAGLLVAAGIVIGIIAISGPDGTTDKKITDTCKYTITKEEQLDIKSYLDGFKAEKAKDAEFVIASIQAKKADDGKVTYTVKIKDNLGATAYKDGAVEYETVETKSKKFVDIAEVDEKRDYILVLQKANKKQYIRDIYPLNEKLNKIDFNKDYKEYAVEFANNPNMGEENTLFYSKVLKYVGLQKGLVKVGKPIADKKKSDKTEVKDSEKMPEKKADKTEKSADSKAKDKTEANNNDSAPNEKLQKDGK